MLIQAILSSNKHYLLQYLLFSITKFNMKCFLYNDGLLVTLTVKSTAGEMWPKDLSFLMSQCHQAPKWLPPILQFFLWLKCLSATIAVTIVHRSLWNFLKSKPLGLFQINIASDSLCSSKRSSSCSYSHLFSQGDTDAHTAPCNKYWSTHSFSSLNVEAYCYKKQSLKTNNVILS